MLLIYSEIGKLKKVLLHEPGDELNNLTPNSLEELLFDDIPWLPLAKKEHQAFAKAFKDNGIEENNQILGIDAVIDKDFASSKLASNINADVLLILTQVKNAKINFGKPNEEDLTNITVKQAKYYLNNDEFKSGSMKPKIEACLNFVTDNKKVAIITDIENAINALNQKAGTIIRYE